MNNLWRITLTEFRHSGLFGFLAVISMPLNFLTFYLFSQFDLHLSARFALPQLVVAFSGIPTLYAFKQKRDRMLAELPVSLLTILNSRYLASLLITLFFFTVFLVCQFIAVPGLSPETLLVQAVSIAGLTFYGSSIWMLLVEFNYHSRRNWWKLVVALLLFIILLFFIAFTIEQLTSYLEQDSPAEEFFIASTGWLLLSEFLISAVIFAISGALFIKRGSYTGAATSPFMKGA